MRAALLFFLLVTVSSLSVVAQKADTSFQKEWLEIDTSIYKVNLTKTALEKVTVLYRKAKQKKLQAQVIKALLYQYSLQEMILAADPNPYLKKIEAELAAANDETEKAILHSISAKLLRQYFNNHRWTFYNRASTAAAKKIDDITTWSSDDFINSIKDHFLRSLDNAALLQQKKTATYEALIIPGNSRELRPTLFDLLVHEALDFFESGESYTTKPVNAFVITDEKALGTMDVFINAVFAAKDSSSLQWYALRLFQKTITFHRNDADKNALLDVNLERLEWIQRMANFPGKETAYRKSLEEITQQYSSTPAASQAWYLLARQQSDKAQAYQPFGDTTNRYGYTKAKRTAEKALALYKENNKGTINLKNLLLEIARKELRTQTEKVNVPNKPFRTLVSFRNIDTVYGRILRVENYDSLRNNMYEPDYFKKVTALPVAGTFVQSLPKTGDHQLHSAEISIKGLPVGEYALLSSSNSSFNDETDKLCIQFFYVSNISYIQNRHDFFVLNRETGQPLTGVKAVVLRQQYINRTRKIVDDTVSTKTTNKNGYFRFEPGKTSAGSYRFMFVSGDDKLNLKEYGYDYAENDVVGDDPEDPFGGNYEKRSNHVFFFTDRSIYRPGQTVFFKGIAVTRDYKTKMSKIITDKDSGWVVLKDMNGKGIDSLKLAPNGYGSFNGKFSLPQNMLTGNFTIEARKYNYSMTSISVEEYKRPAFSVSFDKAKGAYRLNDSVTITGNAKAYAGNNIDGAKVVYSVTRNTRYNNPWLQRLPSPMGGNREITHGEIITDAQGKFTITFKALADDIANKTGNPLFDFSVKADVTDISGETRSGNAQVTVGYASLLVNIMAPSIAEADSLKKISISSSNLSNEKEPALVHIKIVALQPPERLVRKRYWAKPDLFVMNKQEFIASFPTDEYDEESNYMTWPTGAVVSEGTVNTNDTNILTIAPLKSGYYRIEATAKDKYGEEVKNIQYTQIFDRTKEQMPAPAYQFNYSLNTSIQPGQPATFISATMAEHIFMIRKTERQLVRTNSFQFINRNKGFETVTYTPEENDRGGVNISEAYVYDNRVYTYQYRIDVPWNNKQLKVMYSSYRNKTEPGSKETWTVTVQTDKNEKAAAELLTSMYDASLDQFKPHSWSVPNIWPLLPTQNVFTGITNFGVLFQRENYLNMPFTDQSAITYDRLANDGSDLWNKGILSNDADKVMRRTDVAPTFGGTLAPESVYNLQSRSGLVSTSQFKSFAGAELADQKIMIRGAGSIDGKQPLYIVDGKVSSMDAVSPDDIETVTVLKPDEAIALYGSTAANGVVVITTKNKKAPVQVRKNFNETAFFFPQLYADSSGKFTFSFTMPEALTEWKWITLAHTKDLSAGTASATIITQKKLMVQPNAPRFVREGDNMEFSSKIVNLTDKEMTGQVSFELLDAATNTPVDGWFQNVFPSQYFTIEAGQSFAVKFPIQIPFSFNKPLTWRIIARSGDVSDGEENTLPVLTNRMLVTETLPLFVPGDTTVHVVFDKLLHSTSESLTQHGITVEYTSNPTWYAVQALPYLMEYPYECAEQTFNRFYANALASFIVNKHPRIKQVFEKWRTDSVAMKSNLQKNEELKQLLLQETPWVLQAENEEQQKKNIALLFDLVQLSMQTDAIFQKLLQLQLPNGSFSWFKGGSEDRFMTNYIITGIGKLKRLGALSSDVTARINPMLLRAVRFLDQKTGEDYKRLTESKADLTVQQISSTQIDYLYARSFFRDLTQTATEAYNYYFKQGKQFWINQNSYYKAKLGLIYSRSNDEKFATGTILRAVLENTVSDTKQGLYWKTTNTNYWYQSPIEHQSMMIAFASEINTDLKSASLTRNINDMKTWLLLNKQTNNWGTTIATADACYALLLNGSDWLDTDKKVTIQLGKTTLSSMDEKTEAGTGYFKKRIDAKMVNPTMGNITITTNSNSKISQSQNSKIIPSPSWGNIYWQYFEDLDKITKAAGPLSLTKKLFIEKNTDKGKLLEPVKDGDELKTGDKIVVRLELKSDRDMDYLHLKDMRAAAMEPVNVLSGYKWQDRLGYYESTRDASTNFFIDHLAKGTYVFDYPLFVTQTGVFSVGIATIQCMYAPEFTSHSEGIKIRVK